LKLKFQIGYGEEPVIMMIENGICFRLPDQEITLEIIEQFATVDYKSASIQGPIPSPPTILGEFLKFWRHQVKVRGGVLNALLFINEEGDINFTMCFMIYSLPLVTLYVLYHIIRTALSEYREEN